MKSKKRLNRFNFWSRRVDYKTPGGVQGILKNTVSRIEPHVSCTSDQSGSQDNGGMSCNADGNG